MQMICKCMQITRAAPGVHILRLHRQWQESNDEKAELRRRMDAMEEQHLSDLGGALQNVHQEYADKTADAVEKVKLEQEEKLNRAIDEIRALETEKREGSIEIERAKIAELELSLEQLKVVSEREFLPSRNNKKANRLLKVI